MTETPSEALTEFLRERVGDHLESVLAHDDEGTELLYVRDDFPRDETSGTAVALDGEVFAIPTTVLGQCMDAMQG